MKSFLLLLAMLTTLCLYANPVKTINHGSWDDPSIWEGGSVPGINDDIEIKHHIELFPTNANAVNGELVHNGLVIIGYQDGPSSASNPYLYAGKLNIHPGATLIITAGVPNQDAHLQYSYNNDTPHVDHSLINYSLGDMINSIPAVYRDNFFAGSSLIVKFKLSAGELKRGYLSVQKGAGLTTSADLNIFGRADIFKGSRINIGDDLNLIGDWAHLTVHKMNCGDFLVGDDVFIDCLGRITHQALGNKVFVGQSSSTGTPETYANLFTNPQTPQSVLDELSFETLIHYQDYIYHTPNPTNTSIQSLLGLSSGNGAMYTSSNPNNICDLSTDLEIIKENYPGQDPLQQGGEWQYLIKVKNNSSLILSNIKILESLVSNNFDLLSVEAVGNFSFSWETETNSSGQVENYIHLPIINPNSELSFRVTVQHHVDSCEPLINQVDIVNFSHLDYETNLANNTSQVVTSLENSSNVQVSGEIISLDEVEKTAEFKLKVVNLGSAIDDIVVHHTITTDSTSTIENIEISPAGTVTVVNGEFDWDVGFLDVNGEAELTIKVDLDNLNVNQEIRHQYELISPPNLCNPSNHSGLIIIPFGEEAVDLAIEKTIQAGYENPILGQEIKYTIKVSNLSNTSATGIVVEDLIDSNIITSWNFTNPSHGSIVNGKWEIPHLAGGDFATIEVFSTTTQNTCQEMVENTAQILALDQIDIDSSNNSDQVMVNVSGQADLFPTYEIVAISDADRSATIKINVPNNSIVDFSNVSVNIDIPSAVDVIASSSNMGSFNSGVWSNLTIPSGSQAELELHLQVNPTSTITDYQVLVDIISLQPDECNTNNNSIDISFNLPPPEVDLSIEKTVNYPVINQGLEFIYSIEVKNLSSTTTATGIVVEDFVPQELNLVNVMPFTGSYSTGTSGQHILWTIPALGPGEMALMHIRVMAGPGTGANCQYTIENTAEIINVDLPNIGSSTSSTIGTQVLNPHGIELSFEFDPNININQSQRTVGFILKVKGDQAVDYSGVNIQLMIPADFQVLPISQSASTGAYNSNTQIWEIPNLGVNADESLTLTLKLDPASSLTNFNINAAVAASDPINCVSAPSFFSAQFDPVNVDLVIEKTVNVTSGQYGDEVQYLITLTNNGTHQANDIIVNEVYDSGTLLIDGSQVTPSHGTYSTLGVWSGFNLNPGEQATLTVPGTILTTACNQDHVNTVTITQVFPSNSNANNSAQAIFPVTNNHNIKVKIIEVIKDQANFTATVKLEVSNDSLINFALVEIKNNLLSNGLEFIDPTDAIITIPTLAAGATETLEFEVKQNMLIPNFDHSIQSVLNSSVPQECDSEGNQDDFSFNFDPPPFVDIEVKKVANVSEVGYGDEVIYTIEVKNLGNTVANNILIQDLLVPYLNLNSVSDITVSSGTKTVQTVAGQEQISWAIPSVLPYDGTSTTVQTMQIKVTVSAEECEVPIYNQAKFIDVDEIDLNNLNDQDAVIVNSLNNHDLVIVSTHENPFVENNQKKVKVVVSVTNNSLITFNNVLVENGINQNSFEFVDPANAVLSISQILPGQTVNFEMVLVMLPNAATNQLKLESTILSSDQEQCNGDDDQIELEVDFDVDCLCAPWDFMINPNPVFRGSPIILQFISDELDSLMNYATFDLKMYNSAGQLVLTKDQINLNNDGQYQLDQTDFSSGHYIIKIEIYNVHGKKINSELVHSQKLIIL